MLLPLTLFAAGLVMLLLGADRFLKGASGLALHFGISPFIVGLTIVGFGTSAPELAVNLSAALNGNFDLALGNVVGSNIANVGLVLGACALVAPLAVQMRLLRFEGPLMVGAAFVLWLLCLDGVLGRFDGLLLLTGFVLLTVKIARGARDEPEAVKQELRDFAKTRTELWRNLPRIVIGLALLVYGAHLMVENAITLARLWGWSELLIGLTVVAIGTSLPELASSLLAVSRGQTDIAVGNVVGSNIFNIVLILGSTASAIPLPVSSGMRNLELPIMIAFCVAAYLAMRSKRRVSRGEGAALLTGFVAFTVWQAMAAMV